MALFGGEGLFFVPASVLSQHLNVHLFLQVRVEDFSTYIGKLSTPRELVRFCKIPSLVIAPLKRAFCYVDGTLCVGFSDLCRVLGVCTETYSHQYCSMLFQ